MVHELSLLESQSRRSQKRCHFTQFCPSRLLEKARRGGPSGYAGLSRSAGKLLILRCGTGVLACRSLFSGLFQQPANLLALSGRLLSGVLADDLIQRELMLNRFNRLMGEITRGAIVRNTFEPWEIDILVDLQTCPLERRRRWDILRQYQRAVERQMETGPGPPMKLSEFLELREQKRAKVEEPSE